MDVVLGAMPSGMVVWINRSSTYRGIEMNDLIFGHTWEAIQRAQQGGRLHTAVDTSKPLDHSLLPGDMELLEKHGLEGLQQMGFAGVIDRLQRNGKA